MGQPGHLTKIVGNYSLRDSVNFIPWTDKRWMMDYGIGMFLAGLLSGAGLGWYVALMKIRIAYSNPEDLKRELMLYKGLLYKAGLSADGDKGG